MAVRRVVRGVVAAAAALLSLLLAPAAQADWLEPFTVPLNDTGTFSFSIPSVADVNGATVAFDEISGNSSSLVVKALGNSGWHQLGGPLTVNPLAADAKVANVAGKLWIVWAESTGPNASVYAAHWDGAQWIKAGTGSLNVTGSDDASFPSIADVGGIPYVAFVEGASSSSGPESVIVRQYNSGLNSWSSVGAAQINTPGDVADWTSLAALPGPSNTFTPYVAWSEYSPNGPLCNGYVAHVVTTRAFTSGSWGGNQRALSGGCGYNAPALAVAGSPTRRLYLTYLSVDSSGLFGNVVVDSTDGAGWVASVGGSAVNDSQAIGAPSIAGVANTPYVAFAQAPSGGLPVAVVKKFAGSWTAAGGQLTASTDFAFGATIASVAGLPFAAWANVQCNASPQTPPPLNIFAASLSSSASSNTALTSCPRIVLSSYPGAQQGSPYRIVLGVTGGKAPYTWSASGLPDGLAIDPPTGTVSGTPTTAGNYVAAISVTDANGFVSMGKLTIPVAGSDSVTIGGDSNVIGLTPIKQSATPQPNNGNSQRPPFAGASVAGATHQSFRRGVVSFTFSCPAKTPGGRCDEVAALFGPTGPLPSTIARANRATRFGIKSFQLSAGQRLLVHIRLSRTALAQARARRRLRTRLVLVSKDGAGDVKTQTLKVTLVGSG